MKKILFLALFALVIQTNFAQDVFPKDGARWTEMVRSYGYDGRSATDSYFSYILQGDTTIDGTLRSKLYMITPTSERRLVGFFHTQGDSVLFRNSTDYQPYYGVCFKDSVDNLFYDFSLSKGDTVQNCDYPEKYYVSDIDSVKISNGSMRKRLTFSWNGDVCDYWIEGIGSTNGLFYGKEHIPLGLDNKYFICFSVNDELIYRHPEFSECPVSGVFSSIAETINHSFSIFPNPAKETATIHSDLPMKIVQIYDLNGALLHEEFCDLELHIDLKTKSLRNGMYVVKIIFENGNVQTEKLIIKH